MKTLTFPCVVVTRRHEGNERFFAFKSEADFVDWAQIAVQNDVAYFETLESIEDVENGFGDDREEWPDVLKSAAFPVVYIVDENGNEKIEKPEDFSVGDFWFDVWSNDLATCFGLCSEDEAKQWAKANAGKTFGLKEQEEWLGWKISY